MSKVYLLMCEWPDKHLASEGWSLLIRGHRADDPYTYILKVGRIHRPSRKPVIRIVPDTSNFFAEVPSGPSIIYVPLNPSALVYPDVIQVTSEWLWTGVIRIDPRIDTPFEEHLYDVLKGDYVSVDLIRELGANCASIIGVNSGDFIQRLQVALPDVAPDYAARLKENVPRDLHKSLTDQPTVLDDLCMLLLEQLDDIDYSIWVISGEHEVAEALLKTDLDRVREVRQATSHIRNSNLNMHLYISVLEADRVQLRHELAYACALLFWYPDANVPRTNSWHMTLSYQEMWHLSRVPLATEAFRDVYERKYTEPLISRYKNEVKARNRGDVRTD